MTYSLSFHCRRQMCYLHSLQFYISKNTVQHLLFSNHNLPIACTGYFFLLLILNHVLCNGWFIIIYILHPLLCKGGIIMTILNRLLCNCGFIILILNPLMRDKWSINVLPLAPCYGIYSMLFSWKTVFLFH